MLYLEFLSECCWISVFHDIRMQVIEEDLDSIINSDDRCCMIDDTGRMEYIK
ncbi:MAG: hypothetical protein GQ565_05225 [Candidatus Aegiribacteria sp.]|nr:hypothetical protein [Candidatus Aegiribacteria sp.]